MLSTLLNTDNVVYAFSIFYDDVITPNLGYYRTDMTISSTALNQSKLLNYFQQIINPVIRSVLKSRIMPMIVWALGGPENRSLFRHLRIIPRFNLY